MIKRGPLPRGGNHSTQLVYLEESKTPWLNLFGPQTSKNTRSRKRSLERRNFIKSVALGAAAFVADARITRAEQSEASGGRKARAVSEDSDLAKMKTKIALATRMLVNEGIIGSSGHISMRVPHSRQILIGPEDVSRFFLTPEDIITVDIDSKLLAGRHKPPSETEIHTGIYRARPDVMSVIHTHPLYSLTFSITKKPILPIHMHGAIFSQGVPIFDSVHVDTRELGDALGRTLGDCRAILIKMHGAAIVGPTIEEAFVAAIQLEETAQQQLLAESTAQVQPMTPDDIARCIQQSCRSASIQKRWQYYIDKNSLNPV